MLSITTLKSIRKWRDRLFLLRERMLDRRAFPVGRKILFTPWPEIEAAVRGGFRGTRHRVSFGPVPPGGGDHDAVVPVSIEALLAAAADPVLRRRNPLPLPSADAIRLCDDKAALNARLRARGFARHLPGEEVQGRFPYMLKRRQDACARHAFRIDGPADELAHREELASPDYLRQAWIGGDTEFTAHLLHSRGRIRRALTISFRMRDAHAIRGRDPVLLHRRCASRHLPLFAALLDAADFEGLCCVNYKVQDGVPVILEINPRLGFSLAPFLASFVRSFDWPR